MSGILDANLHALSKTDPALASRIASCRPSSSVSFKAAGSGAVLPLVKDAGRWIALHSSVDPVREGLRVYESLKGAGFLVFIGLGAAYHIIPCLEDPGVSGVLVVEEDASFFRSILENVERTRLLGDPRVRFIVNPAPGAVEAALVSSYIPSLMGGIKSFPLRTMKYQSGFTASAAGEIGSAMDRISADFSAQARFAKRWAANTFANLPFIGQESFSIAGKRSVWVFAAGPSLDLQISGLDGGDRDALFLSTDTALPALISRGLRPDAAISIDCQHCGYLHYLCSCAGGGSPAGIPFLFDVSSPPSLVRTADVRFFFAGGHPLSRFISRRWIRLPEVDTSGGNVAYAALSVAESVGAEDIRFFGLDFSYPDGKPYARGTYIPRHFDSRAHRLSPSESRHVSFVLGGGKVVRESIENGWRYTNPLFASYYASMQESISRSPAAVSVLPGRGLPFQVNSRQSGRRCTEQSWNTPRVKSGGWQMFLAAYRAWVAELPVPANPPGISLQKLPDMEKEVWLTLLPLVACLESGGGDPGDRARLLEDAKKWTLSRIDRTLPA
jgi:hypothetical protein